MATLQHSGQSKSTKESTKAKGVSLKPESGSSPVIVVLDVSGKGIGQEVATFLHKAWSGRKVSLTTFRAEDELDQLTALVKSNTRLLDEQHRYLLDFQEVYASSMHSLVEATKAGVSPKMLSVLSSEMGMPKEGMAERLGLASSTVRNKTANSKLLSTDDSEKVIGMSRLIGQVQTMVNEAGNPEGFDAAAWLANWMEQGLPALGGRKPSEYMDTAVGQALVSQLLDQIRSGAYA